MRIKLKVVGKGFNSTGASLKLEVVHTPNTGFEANPTSGDLVLTGLDPEAVKEYGLGAEFYAVVVPVVKELQVVKAEDVGEMPPVFETPQVTE